MFKINKNCFGSVLKLIFSVVNLLNLKAVLSLDLNCSDSNRPMIQILNRPWNEFLPAGSVEINIAPGYSKTYFLCSHSQPVDWVTDIHPVRDNYEMTRSFYQRLNLSNSDSDTNSLHYTVYITFMYQSEIQNPILFYCQSQPVDRGNEWPSFLEITPSRFGIHSETTVCPSTQYFEELHKKLNSLAKIGKKSVKECEMVLNIKELGARKNLLEYKWIAKRGMRLSEELVVNSQSKADQGIYFRNLFRLITQERNCVKILKEEETCSNCTEISPSVSYSIEQGYTGDPPSFLNALGFYAKSEGVEMGFKGVFSISGGMEMPRKFYLEWEVPLEAMVYFQPPPVIYFGHRVTLTCSVSSIYFAYGTVIFTNLTLNSRGFNESYEINLGETEKWKPDGRREVQKNFTFLNTTQLYSYLNLICSAPLWDGSGRVNISKVVYIDDPHTPIINSSSMDKHILEGDEEYFQLECDAYGKPRPELEWIFPYTNQSLIATLEVNISTEPDKPDWIMSTLKFPKITRDYLGSYKCFVQNEFGNSSKSFSLQIPTKGLSTGAKAGIGSGLGILILIFTTIVLLIYRKIVLQRQEYRTKTAEAILEFKKGLKKSREGVDGNLEQKNGNSDHHLSILELPYNDRFEVERDKWAIDEKFLGQGAFGFVRKGEVEVDGKVQVVAVKMLKSSVEIEDFKSFLTELKIMAYIGHHPNVVSLVAACSQNIEERDVMIGVEFCANGNLQEYLMDKRSMFQPNSGISEASNRRTYANLANSVSLTEQDLYTWSYQIANGMEFLSNKKVLHGDLATRNVLLTTDKVAKISDFGLSRVLLNSANYTKKSRVPLPWKWMAIESLKALQFSSASDVWAFGVTLWEISSLGEVPYGGMNYGPEFISQLDQGLRLNKPELASDYLYNIMKHCWNKDIDARVTFPQLQSAFSELLESINNSGDIRERSGTISSLQHSPVAQPRTNVTQPWYSNRPTQVPNLYLNC